jgi:hypothetical protein
MRSVGVLLAGVAALAPRAADAKGCHEVSDVVGLQHCSRFGMWSRDADLPRLWIDIGYFHQRFDSEPFTLAAAPLATPHPLDLATETSGVGLRFLGGIGHTFYTGFELLPGMVVDEPQGIGLQPTYGMSFAFHPIAGVHVERYRIALSAELAPGFRATEFVYCAPGTTCKGANFSDETQARLELQARVRADFYLAPQLSIGVGYGRSLLDRDDHIFMVSGALHIRPMDGMW